MSIVTLEMMGHDFVQPLKVFHGFKHSNNILGGSFWLNVVYGVKNEASLFSKDLAALGNFPPYLLGSAEGKSPLSVYATTPENEPIPVFFL